MTQLPKWSTAVISLWPTYVRAGSIGYLLSPIKISLGMTEIDFRLSSKDSLIDVGT